MGRGINRVTLIGNLGDNPEVNATSGGTVVANLSIATDESYKDKNTGQLVPKTEWHRVVFFSRLAEVARDYLKKGSKVYIEGSLTTRKWQDQNGQDRYTTEIKGREMQMLDSKPEGTGAPQQQAPHQRGQAQPSPMARNPRDYAQDQAQPFQGQDDFDDDIPY
jgi:single-strand DNA-binding protein